jgi:dTDP-4-amino-4,6-dideoxygalactose transaminase
MTTQQLSRLAIFGGQPAFEEPLHVGRPNLGRRERLMERIEGVLDRRWFTNQGPLVQAFEQSVAELTGARNCVAMCNGTIALEIMIRAADLAGEVIVPSFTFVATAHSLQWQEIKPVFCDVDPKSHNIDPLRIEELITPRTTGIIGVHLWGRGCDVEVLEALAERHGIDLFFDASHALACSYKGKMIGGFGRAEVFSFHATKFCNTFEGGAVVTNDDELAEKMRLMRNFGFGGKDNVIYIGSNGKMSEVAAAMGLTSIESHEEFIAVNRANYERYRARLDRIPGLNLLRFDDRERCNFHYVVVDVDAETAHLDRDQLVQILEAENVLARRYFFPGAHRMEPYRSYQPQAGLVLPVTQQLSRRLFQLPTGTAIESSHIDRICDILEFACSHGESVRNELKDSLD